MKRRLVIVAMLPLGVGLAIALWALAVSPEPNYNGRSLVSWLDQYFSNLNRGEDAEARNEEAVRAIRKIGTNSIPRLLSMLRETDSRLETKLFASLQKQHFIRIRWRPASVRNKEAAAAFDILGSEARGAVPDLVSIVEQGISPSSQTSALYAIAAIGPAAASATPSLLGAATNSDPSVRLYAVRALSKILAPASAAVPLLVNCLTDPSRSVRLAAIAALADYEATAKEAVPSLQTLIQSSDERVRVAAGLALKKIDPEAASKTGVR